MSAIYCSNCGAKHTFTYSAPKFCSSCGTSVGVELVKPVSVHEAIDSRTRGHLESDPYEDEDADGNTNIDQVPQLRKIDVDIETFHGTTVTLGSIFNQQVDPSQIAKRSSTSSVEDFVNSRSRRGE